MTDRSSQRALWVLLFGNLVIGTGVLLPAGILTALMADLGVTAGRAGLMMTVGGLVVGIGAPVLAATTSAIDRRLLLTAALLFYVAGHLGSVLTDDLNVLLALRALTVAGAAIFTPQAAATVGLLVPPERRGPAIAFIFIGWSLASVLGIPAGSLLGNAIGWRETFLLMAALSAFGALMVWVVLPGGLRVAPLHLASWVRVFTDWRLLAVLAVTMFSMSGQFTLFTYIAPLLTEVYGLGPQSIALTLLIGGAAGVLGSILATRMAQRLGLERSIMISLSAVAIGVALIWLGWGALWALAAGVLLWNLGGFPANSLQQGRLVAMAPPLASATVALNTSFVYLGQSLGSATGGQLIGAGPNPTMPMAATGFLVTAMLLSWIAARGR
jgi:predicted MFS family arabinose efflux permease